MDPKCCVIVEERPKCIEKSLVNINPSVRVEEVFDISLLVNQF